MEKCDSDKWWNKEFRCECTKYHVCEKDYIWSPSTCICENGKYLASIIVNSVIRCGEIIDADSEA